MSADAPSIRLAACDDAASVRSIYAPYVESTPITFETEVPSTSEIAMRIANTLRGHPWLVCTMAKDVVGYAYAGAYRTRAAYQWSAEVTVYVRTDQHRRGVGRALYTALLALLPLQNFYNAYAMITVPNAGSVGLHESLGFTPAGVTRRVGFKLGRWHDVGTWERALQEPVSAPAPPNTLAAVLNTEPYQQALARGTAVLRS